MTTIISAQVILDLPEELRLLLDCSGLSNADIVRAEDADLDVSIRPVELPATDEDEPSRVIGYEIIVTPETVMSIGIAAVSKDGHLRVNSLYPWLREAET